MHCSRCGTDMAIAARFCAHCGAPASKRLDRRVITYALLFAAVLLAGVGIWLVQGALAHPDAAEAVSLTSTAAPVPYTSATSMPTLETEPTPEVSTPVRSATTVRPTPTPKPKLKPVAAQPSPRVTITVTPNARTTPAPPKGTVQIQSYQRLPDNQQDEYACDKLVLTIVNRSNAPVDTVTVTFATSYLAATADGGSSTGSPHTGPNVTRTATAGIAPYDRTSLGFSVCVPSAKSPFVYASPAKIIWKWA